jgi:hypothetical protein
MNVIGIPTRQVQLSLLQRQSYSSIEGANQVKSESTFLPTPPTDALQVDEIVLLESWARAYQGKDVLILGGCQDWLLTRRYLDRGRPPTRGYILPDARS